MMHMLASVRSVQEAEIAIKAGVDIIDLKDPQQGALGALSLPEIKAIVRFVDGRKVVSATIGDLPMDPDLLFHHAQAVANTGVDIVKVGFFGNIQTTCLDSLKSIPVMGCKLVAVLMADMTSQWDVDKLKQAGFYGVMLDTSQKNGKNLLNFVTEEDLESLVRNAHQLGLKVGLAGAIKLNDINKLLRFSPDFIGFRSALCENEVRSNGLSIENTRKIAGLLLKYN